MANWHLDDLRHALERKGWSILAEYPGNDYSVSGSWEIQRSTNRPEIWIDFNGLDDMNCLPMEQSYGCEIRGLSEPSLSFRKLRSRHLWPADLQAFIEAIEAIDADRHPINAGDERTS